MLCFGIGATKSPRPHIQGGTSLVFSALQQKNNLYDEVKVAGYVYVLLNPAFPDLLKIGKTERHPRDRAKELAGTGSPYPFVVAFWRYVYDPDKVERELHLRFSENRASQQREFFSAEVVDVIEAMSEYQKAEIGSDNTSASVTNPIPKAAPYLYRMRVTGQPTFSRISSSDIPKSQLHYLVTVAMQKEWPQMSLKFNPSEFIDVRDLDQAQEILRCLPRPVAGMPNFYTSVSMEELSLVAEGHAQRIAEIKKIEETERGEIIAAVELDYLKSRI